jgi:two-component system response regulator DesR
VVRILLAEPMSLLRGALATVLSAESDLEVVGELGRIDEVVPLAWTVRPDIVLINIGLITSGEVVDELTKELPDCALVMLVDVDMSGAIRRELATPVHGFVGKDTPPAELVEYLRRVARGERVIDPALAVAAWTAPRNPLNKRESAILRAVAEGLTSAEIANMLHLSAGTVRNHLSSIMRKTGARTRLEAARIATEAGWIQIV